MTKGLGKRRALPALSTIVLSVSIFAQNSTNVTSTAGMALIPGATFKMGTDKAEISGLLEKFSVRRAELFEEETPKHSVTLGPFYLDRTEVTNAQFKLFLDKNSSWQKDKADHRYHNGKYLDNWNGNDPPAGRLEHPVVFVSWFAAAAYCQAQGKRLPSEAEWEYAARGGLIGKEFPWGDELPDKTRANLHLSGHGAPVKVASYPANGYGLYDIAGNVWEYMADEWQKYPLISSSPNSSADAAFLTVKTRRALRGGSFGGAPVNLRVRYRDSHLPTNAGDHVGFRCAVGAK